MKACLLGLIGCLIMVFISAMLIDAGTLVFTGFVGVVLGSFGTIGMGIATLFIYFEEH
jgi:hypothetical protein